VTGGAGADSLYGNAGNDALNSRDGVSGNDPRRRQRHRHQDHGRHREVDRTVPVEKDSLL
jgi:hypothetical protein